MVKFIIPQHILDFLKKKYPEDTHIDECYAAYRKIEPPRLIPRIQQKKSL